jgi:hypothetical protein
VPGHQTKNKKMKIKNFPSLLPLLAASVFVVLNVSGQVVTKPVPSQSVLVPVVPAPPGSVKPAPVIPEPVPHQLPGFTNQLPVFTNQLPGFTNRLTVITNR